MKETININKKIKALRLFRKFFFRKETGIYILSGSITSMCILIKIARIIPESLFIKFLLIFIFYHYQCYSNQIM